MMFSIIPLLLSVFMFYLASLIHGPLAFAGASLVLAIGVLFAVLEISAFISSRKGK
jgi:hypothetical protein